MAPLASKATSKALAFFTRMSENCLSWARATAWSFTISRTARNATIIACREGQASKNSIRRTVLVVAGENLARSCAIIWATVKVGCCSSMRDDFFPALEDLLEDSDEIDERDDEIGFGAFVVVERSVGPGPDVLFDLLLLVEQLGGVFEFFVLDQALDEFGARVGGLLFGGPASGSGGRSIFDLM